MTLPATGVQEPGINFDQALTGMEQTFSEAINRNLEVNQISTEGKTAVEAARTKPV